MDLVSEAEEIINALGDQNISAKDNIFLNDISILALFDTGCKPYSVINKQKAISLNLIIRDSRKVLSTAKKGTKVCVEGSTQVNIKYKDIIINNMVLYVVEDLSDELIISLHDILRYFMVPFYELMINMKNELELQEVKLLDSDSIIMPWSRPYEEAPELKELYEPFAFCDYLNMSYEEAKQKYFDLLKTNICPIYKENSSIMNLMTSELALSVFVNLKWEGLNIPEFKINVMEGMPKHIKPVTRKINPKIYEVAKKEFMRLLNYFYEPSDSPIAVPLVVAPKATPPGVRFCGDYKPINKWIERNNYPIPLPREEIQKILGFKFFQDVDMRNAFHQVILALESRKLLSVQTPWGQFQPKFMPEGISAATQKLQQAVREIFINEETESYMIQLHDNILILSNSYEESVEKMEKFLKVAAKHRVSLKMEKSRLGYTEVEFFGYVCSANEYHLSDKRKESINSLPFPEHHMPSRNIKSMQSILGCAVYFKPFVPEYALHAQPLYNSISKDFDWSSISNIQQLRIDFDIFKEKINAAQMLHYPDYNLEWTLQTDASKYGIGGVLLQRLKNGDQVPIVFISKTFSKHAREWSTIQAEAYAIYYCVKELEHMLICKDFIVETDHQNLKWMENSINPNIVRMYLYLRGFNMFLRHIPGHKNKLADLLSRIDQDKIEPEILVLDQTDYDILNKVHNSTEGHFGVRTTWRRLNKYFPDHSLSQDDIREFIHECMTCQKNRRPNILDQVQPIHRPLPKEHMNYVIGIDFLTVTPKSNRGNTGLYVVRNITTKHSDLFPAETHDATQAATAIYEYITRYGLVEALLSDPGSDFTSKTVDIVNQFLGIKHHLSIVDRHESNGVERTNAEILKHLRDYVFDSRLINDWDSPIVLATIRYFLNFLISSETGISPMEATFGSVAYTYQKLLVPKNIPKSNAFLTLLNDSIATANDVLTEHIRIIDERRSKNNIKQLYQPGDWVMHKVNVKHSKLKSPLLGPYQVIKHENNNVLVRHPCKDADQTLHSERLFMFFGTDEQAKEAALRDDDQYFIEDILDYKGDPTERSRMEFLVLYVDSSQHWVLYSNDITSTEAYERFCLKYNELLILLKPSAHAVAYNKELSKRSIPFSSMHKSAWINLRSYGYKYYDSKNLAPCLHLVPCLLGRLRQVKNVQKIELTIPLFDDGTHLLDYPAYFNFIYLDLPEYKHVIVDENMLDSLNLLSSYNMSVNYLEMAGTHETGYLSDLSY